MRKVSFVIVLALFAFGLTGCGQVAEETLLPLEEDPYEPVVSATGKVVPAVWTSVGAQTIGAVVELPVHVGDEVSAGALLVRLDASDAHAAVDQAEAALEVAKAQLALAKAPNRPEEVAVAQARVDAAGAAVAQAMAQRDELKSETIDAQIAAARARVAAAESEQLAAREVHEQTMKCHNVKLPDGRTRQVCPDLGTVEEQARQNLNAANQALAAARSQLYAIAAEAEERGLVAQAGVQAAEAQREVALAQLELLQAPPTSERIAVAEASVAQAEIALEAARTALARYEVRAPFGGVLSAVLVQIGEVVGAGQPLATLGDLATIRIETTDLDEVDVARVTVGQRASVSFDALPGDLFSGRVTRVAPMLSSGSGGVNYTAIIELDEIADVVRWGMTAFVDIEIE